MSPKDIKRLKSTEEEERDKPNENLSNVWPLYQKDSFYRFGDDLCELILSYLSFEDKFRFECLSKQIQRFVFNKQTDLVFDNRLKNILEETDAFDRNYIDVQRVATILKKMPNIRRISISFDVKSMDRFVSLITEYCHHLNSIQWNFQKMSDKTIKTFCQKFGPQMKTILVNGRHTPIKTILKCCPNLESLDIKDLNRYLSILFTNNSKPFLQKLKSFSFTFKRSSIDIKNIVRIIENNRKTLESFEVKISSMIIPEDIIVLLFNLSKLSKMKRFVFISNTILDSSLLNNFFLVGDKCQNIKELHMSVTQYMSPIIRQFLLFISRFRQLKRLTFISFGGFFNPLSVHTLKSREVLNCKQLTQLKIISSEVIITDEFFTDIDKHLPKLETIEANGFITNNVLQSLTKISNLTKIALKSNQIGFKVNKTFIKCLVKDCRKLRSIHLSNVCETICLQDFEIFHLRQNNGSVVDIKVYQLIYGFHINKKKFSLLL